MLRHDQDRQHLLLVQVGEQLVYLERQKAFLWHCLQIAVKAVYDHDGGVSLDYASTDERSELAGRHLCRIDLMQYDIAGLEQRAEFHSDPPCPFDNALGALVERVDGGALALFCRMVCDAERHRGFPGPGRTDEQRAGAAAQAAAEQRIELLRAAAND